MRIDRSQRIIRRIISQFKSLRLSMDMSHETLAKKSGVTRAAISHIESGKRKPSLNMSLKLAEALDRELSEIVRDAEKDEEK